MNGPPAFTIRMPAPYTEPSPRWVRVKAGDAWLADSRRASLLVWYGPGMLPTYCFPEEDVRLDLVQDDHGARRLEGLTGDAASAST